MEKLSLAGTWQLRNAAETFHCPAAVPGDNISALLKAGLIPDPYQGKNENRIQWIGGEDWIFSTVFSVPSSLAKLPHQFLTFDTLDTLAVVSLNGIEIGRTENMIIR